MTKETLIKNVRPMGGQAADILVRDGRIVSIGSPPPAGSGRETIGRETIGRETIDGRGAIAVPGFVEAHTHLDKTLWGMPWYVNDVGPRLLDRIENERRLKVPLDIDPERQSARQVVQSIRMGTTHIRTHVDVDTEFGLTSLEGVMRTRERFAKVMDMQIVAFPQSGMLVRPGTVEMLDAALSAGADIIGGIDPSGIDRDPKGHVDAVFRLAEKHGKPVDIHLHEPGELGAFAMELIIERTRALGMKDKVVISHAFCLGMPDQAYVDQLLEGLAGAGIAIMTNGPSGRPCPAVKRVRAAGVAICSGSDGIRDTWGPYGSADMLERAMLIGMRNGFRRDDELAIAFEIVTSGGAQVMALDGYGIEVGCKADLVLLDNQTVTEAIVSHGPRALVMKNGTVVVRQGEALVGA